MRMLRGRAGGRNPLLQLEFAESPRPELRRRAHPGRRGLRRAKLEGRGTYVKIRCKIK